MVAHSIDQELKALLADPQGLHRAVELDSVTHRHHEDRCSMPVNRSKAPLDLALETIAHQPRQLDVHQIGRRRHRGRVRLPQPLRNQHVGRTSVELAPLMAKHGLRPRVRVDNMAGRVESHQSFRDGFENILELTRPGLDLC